MNEVMTKLSLLCVFLISVSIFSSGCEEFEQDACVVGSSDCRETLGLGSVCLANGFCSAAGIVQKEGTTVPVSCSSGRVFPSDAAERPEDFGDAAVIGVIARTGTKEPLQGVELAIREFVIAADATNLDVIAITCVVDDTARDVDAQLQAAARYLADDIDAKVLMVAGLREDLQTVIEAGSGFDVRDESSSPAIFPFSSLNSSQSGGILFSTIPTQDIENLALADRVRQAIGTPGTKPVRVIVFQNNQVFQSTDSSALDAALDAAIDNSDVIISPKFFTCNCQSGCSEEAVRSLLDPAVDEAAGEELHLIFTPGCDRAAQTIGVALNSIANEEGFDDFTDTVASITLTGEAFSKGSYAGLSGLKKYEDIMRGVSPAGNPGSDDYKTFQASYQSVFSDQAGLASSPLVAHAADATWLSILGYFAAYTENGDSTAGLTSAEVRAGMRRFIDSDVCSSDECPEALSFPRTVASFGNLSRTLVGNGSATFQVSGASGPLRFATDKPTTVVEEAFFTQWKITNPASCLVPFGGSSTNPSNFFCAVLSGNSEDYVIYPKN